MAHLFLLYAPPDAPFARQLATQLEQRGLVLWPVPDPDGPLELLPDPIVGLETASHVVIVLSPGALAAEEFPHLWDQALEGSRHLVVVQHEACDIPAELAGLPQIDFRERFLLAVEDLVKRLEKVKVPTRPLTVEHPPPVAKLGLLPVSLPAERCWREDRLRINYNLPIIMTQEELEVRMPAFLAQTGFQLVRATTKQIKARRSSRYPRFDPRRAEHTLTIRQRKGSLRVRYEMARLQVYHWFPAHYRVLDREAAALFRYLAMEDLQEALLPVEKHARLARMLSWAVLVMLLVLAALIGYIAILELAGLSVFG